MPTVSGRLMFDRARTAASSTSLAGIAGVPIVLQNTASGAMLVVSTDSDGHYAFTGVPNGSYQIVEAYGTPVTSADGDFAQAIVGPLVAGGKTPPISYVSNPPQGSTHLDCTTRNTLLVNVEGANLTGENFLNGPVRYTPIEAALDSGAVISPANLIALASNGTFGTFAPGTVANTGASPNPYTNIGSNFTYVLPDSAVVTPNDGQYTIQNIMNNSHSNTAGTWWRIADHTFGNEIGRMMIINGSHPGWVFFEETVTVIPHTDYLFSSWILNMCHLPGYVNPQLGVNVFDSNGDVLYSATLGELIPEDIYSPEWRQIGTVINSLDNTSLRFQFVSMGPAATGNDYAIDDIALNEIDVPVYTPVKSANVSAVTVGNTVDYTVTLRNTGANALTDVAFTDNVPDGLSFIAGTVRVNGIAMPAAEPNSGFSVPDIAGGDTLTVNFSVKADYMPLNNPAENTAQITYWYSPIDGGIPNAYDVFSNNVTITIRADDPKPPISAEDALNIVIASIGLDELALAHILNGEGEKIQYVLGTLQQGTPPPQGVTIGDVLDINKSVVTALREVTKTEILLQTKLENATELLQPSRLLQLLR